MTEDILEQVQNKLIIRAESFRSLKKVIGNFSGKDSLFDFDQVIKTPEDLKAVYVGRTFSSKGQLLTEWLENSYGEVSELSSSFRSYLLSHFGHTNWRDWRLENWGTIWNPRDIKLTQTDEHEIEYQFLTVHPPEGIIKGIFPQEGPTRKTFDRWCIENNIKFIWSVYNKEDIPRIFSSLSKEMQTS